MTRRADDATAAMLDALAKDGVKLTAQRRAVVAEFAGDFTHPTAQDIFARLRDTFPGMSFATVYNTLARLEASGLCRRLAVDGKSAPTRFDPNTAQHHHAVCDRCGAIRDVEATQQAVPAPEGFDVRTVEFLFRGLCGKCQRRSPGRDAAAVGRIHRREST